MEKIQMKTPLVEMDGDEMTRVLWKMIKDELICPFVELKTEYYDLGLLHRNETKDQVTVDAALATRKFGVAVKCATITPNAQRMAEYPQLTEMWKSPNGTIRSILDGTVFRAPILLDSIKPVVRNWEKPITIAMDDEGRYMYYSFTDRLIKADMRTGEIVGSVTGLLAGGIYGGGAHMGCLAYHEGKVYGSLEYKAAEKFYVAVFDCAAITRMDMDYKTPGDLNFCAVGKVVIHGLVGGCRACQTA